jgi:sigma-54 dependent transcriptional regulator, acetoin dehydrogenase operon transcriptional activator AcoR
MHRDAAVVTGTPRRDPLGGREIRLAWERFNSDDLGSSPAIRESVLASWRRSRQCGVRPDDLAVPQDVETDTESRFRWAAEPVLQDLAERLSGTSNAILLADNRARLIHRWVLDTGLLPVLDRDFVTAQFCFGEEHVGTNGLGCPVEERRPFVVAGPEHYKDAFHHWTCVGAPVFHPISRQLEGIIDISCLYKDTNDLILPLVIDAVRHVEERLFLDASRAEQTLLRHYLPVAKGSTRAVTALSDRTIMTNPLAARLLQNIDQAELWEHASQAVAANVEGFHEFPLSPEETVAVRCTPIHDGGQLVGALLEFTRDPVPKRRNNRRRDTAPVLEGLPGKSAVWRAVSAEALLRVNDGLPLLVVGEAGAGKLSFARAICAQSFPGRDVVVLDCAQEPVDGVAAWSSRARKLLLGEAVAIFRHLDALGPESAAALSGAIDGMPSGPPHVLATLTATARLSPECLALVERFAAGRVEVPALRQRREDIPDIVTAILRRHGDDTERVRLSSDALQVLMRGAWPLNIRQLENALRSALSNRCGPEIGLGDLPCEVKRQATRRTLSPIEQVELDAIMAALEHAGHNRTRAASALGISRATLHRRLRAYGLALDRSAF